MFSKRKDSGQQSNGNFFLQLNLQLLMTCLWVFRVSMLLGLYHYLQKESPLRHTDYKYSHFKRHWLWMLRARKGRGKQTFFMLQMEKCRKSHTDMVSLLFCVISALSHIFPRICVYRIKIKISNRSCILFFFSNNVTCVISLRMR